MAVYKTYDTVGIREDLADIIYSISPTETPFMSGVAKTKATTIFILTISFRLKNFVDKCNFPLALDIFEFISNEI